MSNAVAIAEPGGGNARKTMTYAGVVTDEAGRPITDVEVRATPLEKGGEPKTAVTNQQGRFELSGVSQFYHDRTSRYLVFEHPDYGVAWRWLTAVDAQNPHFDPADLHVRMSPRLEFGGLITNSAGQPVKGAQVSAHLKQFLAVTPGVYTNNHYSITAATDDQGHFRFPNLSKGAELALQVRHPDYVTFGQPAGQGVFPYKADEGPVEVQLLPGASVQGRLLFNGKPLPRSGVVIHVTDPQKREPVGHGRTDAEGRYRITGLEAKPHVVHLLAGEDLFGGLTAVPVQVTTETVKIVSADLVCVRGVLVAGRVTDQQGRAVAQSRVGGRLLGLPRFSPSLFGTLTDDDGRFRLRLPAGSYDVNTTDWRPLPAEKREQARLSALPFEAVEKVVVTGAAPKPIEFRVTKGAALKTHLVDAAGRAVKGSATIAHGDWAHSDDRGYVAFRFVPTHVSMDAGFAISDDKTLAAGFYWPAKEEEPPEEIVLKPLATLTGRVHDEGGADITADMFGFAWTGTDGARSTIAWHGGIAWPAVKDDGSFQIKLPTGVPLTVKVAKGSQEITILPPTDLKPDETRDVGEIGIPRSE